MQGEIQYGSGMIQSYELKSGLQDEERKGPRERIDLEDDDDEETKKPA